jgi:hypothetical protein
MMRHILSLQLAALTSVVLLTACGEGGARSETSVSTTTVGQQLIDLKKALDAGALTPEEYAKGAFSTRNASTALAPVEARGRTREPGFLGC